MIIAARAGLGFKARAGQVNDKPSAPRTSDLLRNVLLRNPDTQSFTIGDILTSLGPDRVEASLILFSAPAMLPMAQAPSFCPRTATAVGAHFATGRKDFQLPKAILDKQVPRRSLAVAIHTLLPVMEFAEKKTRPRLAWASHPVSRWIVGVLLFILAATIAFPVIGMDPLHAMSIFVISLGLAEKDGLAILLGVVAGVLSLAMVALSSVNVRALRAKVGKYLKRITRRFGFKVLANYCERRGWVRLAAILRFDLSDVLLAWNPEARETADRSRAAANAPAEASSARRSLNASKPVRIAARSKTAKIGGKEAAKGRPATS